MKNKILLFISVIIIIIYIMSFQNKKTHFSLDDNKDIYINVKIEDNNIEKILLEDYILGVVAGEMPASFELEALKAQAVASRTYALYKINQNKEYDVSVTIKDQVYVNEDDMKEKWGNDFEYYYLKIKEAVTSTNGLYISYNNKPICAYYFAISNGYTEDSKYVFKTELNYIKSVNSEQDKNVKNYEVVKTMTKDNFCKLLDISCNSIEIKNQVTNETGHTISIDVNNKSYLGTEIRNKLNLRSTDFSIKINTDYIEITTKGYGHGVGMSQYGANELAKQGYNYEDIIKYYYQNISIDNINV